MNSSDSTVGVESGRRARPEEVERRAWFALVLAASTSLVIGLAVTAVNVAFPAIEKDFAGADRSTLAWGITGYSIGLASLLLLGGRLADHVGRRRVFSTGVSIFIIASLFLALAPNAWCFVGARLGQAVGAALLGPASLSLVLEGFPASRRLSAIATWSGMGTLGAAIGPSFAAVITEQWGWRWIFVLPLIICLTSVVFAPRLLPEGLPKGPASGRLDAFGSIIGTLGVGLLAATISQGPRLGWTHPVSLATTIGALVLLPLFIHRCRHHPQPLMDLQILAAPTIKAVNLVNVGLTAAGTASWLLYPLFLVQQWHYSLFRVGLALTPLPIVAVVTGIMISRLAERVGTRTVIRYGAPLPALGLLTTGLRIGTTPHYVTDFLVGGILFNLGFGIVYTPMTGLALREVADAKMSQATAIFNALRQLAGGLGVATVIAIMGNARVISLPSFCHAFVATGIMAGFAGIVVLTGLRVPEEFRRSRRMRLNSPRSAIPIHGGR